MKLVQPHRRRTEFEPLVATAESQAAIMELPPGGKSDEVLGNEHPHSEQWLYVIAGTGAATVVSRKGRRAKLRLRRGMLLVIERGELHQITNSGRRPLKAISFYIPPAYRSDGRLRRRPQGAHLGRSR